MGARTLIPASLAAVLVSGCAVGFTGPPTYISDRGATLNGAVFSNVEGETAYWFRYGTTAAYGSETARRGVAANDTEHLVSAPVAGLAPAATYHYQLCVKDADERPERVCTKDRTVTTRAAGVSGLVFISTRDAAHPEVYRMDVDGSGATRLTNTAEVNNWNPSWSADGTRIAWAAGRGGQAGDFQTTSVMNADGSDPTAFGLFSAEPDFSPDDTKIAFRSAGLAGCCHISVMNADGSGVTALTAGPAYDAHPGWSPEGSRLVFDAIRDGDFDSEIYVMRADGRGLTPLTSNSSVDWEPAWSPDGTKIAFASNRDGNYEIYVTNADGTHPTRLTSSTAADRNPTWSPDGTRIAFDVNGPGVDNVEIYVMNADGANPTRLTSNQAVDFMADWSPRP